MKIWFLQIRGGRSRKRYCLVLINPSTNNNRDIFRLTACSKRPHYLPTPTLPGSSGSRITRAGLFCFTRSKTSSPVRAGSTFKPLFSAKSCKRRARNGSDSPIRQRWSMLWAGLDMAVIMRAESLDPMRIIQVCHILALKSCRIGVCFWIIGQIIGYPKAGQFHQFVRLPLLTGCDCTYLFRVI